MDDKASDSAPVMFGFRESNQAGEIINFSLDGEDIDQIALVTSLGRLRDVERRVSEASGLYMELNETDMLALRFLQDMTEQIDMKHADWAHS